MSQLIVPDSSGTALNRNIVVIIRTHNRNCKVFCQALNHSHNPTVFGAWNFWKMRN